MNKALIVAISTIAILAASQQAFAAATEAPGWGGVGRFGGANDVGTSTSTSTGHYAEVPGWGGHRNTGSIPASRTPCGPPAGDGGYGGCDAFGTADRATSGATEPGGFGTFGGTGHNISEPVGRGSNAF